MDVNEMNLSLNGCGYLGIYHVGVCACIKEYYPQVLRNKMSGGSVGALIACAYLCGVPSSACVRCVFDVSVEVRKGILGPMSPGLHVMKLLYDRIDRLLPPDAHLRCDGLLHVSVTRFDNGQNSLLNRFNSREELLQALMCSCFIPVYSGYEPPVFRGVAYVDAALSNNSPLLDKHTVTVAPFDGNSDICPDNDGFSLRSFTLSNTSIGITTKNFFMMIRVLFPGSPDMQKDYCQRGYNDALRFLRDNGLVPCPDCVSEKNQNSHLKCKPLEQQPLPRDIIEEFEKSTDEFRQNLSYQLFQYKSMKVLYYMNIPSIVTAKVVYMAISAILEKVQNKAGISVEDVWRHFLQFLKAKMNLHNSRLKRRTSYSMKGPENDSIQYELETTENEEEVPENNRTSSFPDACARRQCTNDSWKFDFLLHGKTEQSGTL